jgi:hypothetical protein
MICLRIGFVGRLTLVSVCHADDKGFCPPSPPKAMAPPKEPASPPALSPDQHNYGTVTWLTVISDKGYACSARVLRGLNKELDKRTETDVRQRRFDPGPKFPRAVPLSLYLDVDCWTNDKGEVVDGEAPPALPHLITEGRGHNYAVMEERS